MLPTSVIYYGEDRPLPEQITLQAGPLSLIYENGDLRYIRYGQHEILRRVYVAVRDHNWDTILPVLSDVEVEQNTNAFRIAYQVTHQQDEVDFRWIGRIEGTADGVITFTMDGQALSTFRRNRIGFCVLHPGEVCAGKPCRVEHTDGQVEESHFPEFISPHQPFFDMQAISHEVAPGVWAEVHFSGEVFEMEDQRNWTDASFKTYCTPLGLPFPVEVAAGTKITQTIRISLTGAIARPGIDAVADTPRISLDAGESQPLPPLGLGLASHGKPLSETELARLKALQLNHLRVDLHLSDPDYPMHLQQATEQALALKLGLEMAVFVSDEAAAELESLAGLLADAQPPVWHWLIFHEDEKSTTAPWLDLARAHLSAYNSEVPLGGGSNAYFTELNRGRPPVKTMDLVAYSLNPQVHAFDNASLVETLAAQADTVRSTHHFSGGLPLAVTPITLRPRFNPNATGPEPEPEPGQLPPQVDPRQMSLFGAGWTAISLKYLSLAGGLRSLTYYETTGPRGLMETEAGSPVPDLFHSRPEMIFPLYHVFALAGDFAGGEVLATESTRPLLVDSLALRKEDRRIMLLVSFSAQPQTVELEAMPAEVQVRRLDEHTLEAFLYDPAAWSAGSQELYNATAGRLSLTVPPFGLLRLDLAAD